MDRVETVTGAISPNDLGITLPHEHLLVDFRSYVKQPEEDSLKWIVDAPISIENLEMFTKHRDISKDNLHLTDIPTAITADSKKAKNLNQQKISTGRAKCINRELFGHK